MLTSGQTWRSDFEQIKAGFIKEIRDPEVLLPAKLHAVSEKKFSGYKNLSLGNLIKSQETILKLVKEIEEE